MVTTPTSYFETYNRVAALPAAGTTAFLAPFAANSGTAPATLRDRVIAAPNDYPKVFLVATGDPIRISSLHRTTKFISPYFRPGRTVSLPSKETSHRADWS